jgi:transposase
MKPQTLGRWVQKARQEQEDRDGPKGLSRSEREELERLRREVADLKMQLEFAKKAAAWFAKGQR